MACPVGRATARGTARWGDCESGRAPAPTWATMATMASDALLVRARTLWTGAAGVPLAFGPAGHISVVVAPRSRLCPPSWVGIVVLGQAAIVTAPTERLARLLVDVLAPLQPEAIADLGELNAVLPVIDALGPATLAYVDAADFRPALALPASANVVKLPSDGGPATGGPATGGPATGGPATGGPAAGGLDNLLSAAGASDADESGLAGITSPAFVIRERNAIVAAAGYRVWPSAVAHQCVLTAPRWRGKGLARAVASAATAHALSHALLPQWRARPLSSRRVAAALGYRELGQQLSVRLAADPNDQPSPHGGPATP